MDIISLEELNRLYWLGRYTERVYTTIREYLFFEKLEENKEDN